MITESESDNVRVVVRCRPMSQVEINNGYKSIVNVDPTYQSVSVINPQSPKDPPREFTFDAVFGENTDQLSVYNVAARPIVDNVLKGYNGTILAYGQTGTGKTFTMSGSPDPPELAGIIPNTFAHIFDHISKCQQDKTFLVRVSYLELYNEEIRDLLAKGPSKSLEIKERSDIGVYVKDLSSISVSSADQMQRIMQRGSEKRSVGATNMNEKSSRSHAVFTITIECSETVGGYQHLTQGKLQLVDLAGSERQSKAGTTGDRLKEASRINLSLSTLGSVISALVDPKSTHIPYRNSKLTRLLQDSLGGNSKTVMCANIGPASYNYDETVSTLRYSNRAKSIKNIARINEDPKDALLKKFQLEIESLRRQLDKDESTDSGEEENEENDETKKKTGNYDERISEMQKIVDEKRNELEKQKGLANEEKLRLTSELEIKEIELANARSERQKLVSKLSQLEKKLIVGGENMLEKAEKQAYLLEQSNTELELARANETHLRQALAEKNQERIDLEEKYNSLAEESQGKSKKLKKVWVMLNRAKTELADVQNEHQREMEGLLDSLQQLRKQLQLEMLVIDSYIPTEYQELIERYVWWNDEIGDWQLKCIAYTGNNMRARSTEPAPKFDLGDSQMKNIFLSYSNELGSYAHSQSTRSRLKSAKREKNAARLKELLT
ncbi:hypothetical protein AB6A40_002145 [Gnathostoma spinigerum]|uniref:Kinesin-like protein n=1 Tax=Gnathostoma spinigerum TaxID=75299 RepID=A0ABD6E8C4_9BILA